MQNTKTISAIVALFFIMSSNNLTASGKLPHTPAPYASSASNVSTPSGRTHVDNSAQEESEHTVGSIRTMWQVAVDTVCLVAEKASNITDTISSFIGAVLSRSPSVNVAFGQRNNEVEQSGDTYSGDTNSNNTNSGIVNSGTYNGGDTNSNNTNNGTVNSGTMSGDTYSGTVNNGTVNNFNNYGCNVHYNINYYESAVTPDVKAAVRTAETERDDKKYNLCEDKDFCPFNWQ